MSDPGEINLHGEGRDHVDHSAVHLGVSVGVAGRVENIGIHDWQTGHRLLDSPGHGIGRKLFEAIVAWAVARPHPGHLEWQASPPAVEFYRQLGFEPDYESDLKEYPFYDVDLRLR